MATKYGSWGWHSGSDGWRSVLVYSVSETSSTYTISATLQIQCAGQYSMAQESISGTLAIGDSSSSQTLSRRDYNPNTVTTIVTKSRTYNKGASVQNVTVSGTVKDNDSGDVSTVSQAFTIQRRSYPVTYNANGGEAASVPAAQTKYQGVTLTLSSTVPTRPGFTFLGWNTNDKGTGTKYAPSASYTGNAALTLYAMWLGVSVPSIECARTDFRGEEADEGTYGSVAASWQAVGSPAANVTVTATNVTTGASITLTGDTSGSKAAQQELTGNVSSLFGADEGQIGALDTDTRYAIRITVTVSATGAYAGSSVTATSTAYITFAYITMDFLSGGHGVAFGKTAVREGFDNAMEPNYAKVPAQHDTDLRTTTIASVITANTSVATVTGVDAKRWGKVAQIQVNFTNVAAISVPADGNIGDITIGTLAEGLRPAISTGGQSFGDNAGQAWYYINAAGNINLCAVEGTGAARTIPARTLFNCVATFILP